MTMNDFGTAGEPSVSGLGTGQTGGQPAAVNGPPQPVNAAGTLPATAGAQDPDFLSASDAVTAADKAVTDASNRYTQLLTDFQNAQTNAATDISGERLRSATTAFDTAQRDLANASQRAADARTKLVTAAEQAASRAKDPAQQNYYNSHAQQAQAEANLALANVQALNAKTPAEVAQANAAANKANAEAQSLGILTPAQAAQANSQANVYSAQATQIAALTPSLVTKSQAEATTAAAQANVAPAAAQAAVDKAQADADKARADVAETNRRIANMPTEQQAQAAIDLGLHDKQADLDAKQQALEQARQLLPGAVAQQQANIAQTQATTAATTAGVQKGALGPLYGIGDQIDRYKQMIASGQLKPEDANAALTSYLNAQVTGATDFQRQQQIDTYNQAIRGQDVSLINNRLSTGAGFAQNTLGTIGQLAAGAGPGHGQEMAQAFQSALNMGRQFFGQIGGLQTPQTAPSAVSQAPVVHINIGSGAPSSAGGAAPAPASLPAPVAAPSLPAAPPPIAMPAPDFSQNPTADSIVAGFQGGGGQFASSTPSSPPDQTNAGDQTDQSDQTQAGDIPAMARGGIVTRPTVALIGERGPEAVVPLHPALTIAQPQHVLEAWKNEIASGRVRVPGAR